MVKRTILRLAFPGGKPRPKPGPYRADDGELDDAGQRPTGPAPRRASRGPGRLGPEQRDDGVRVSMPDED